MATIEQTELASNTALDDYYSSSADVDKIIDELSTPVDTVEQQTTLARQKQEQQKGRSNREQSRYGISLTPAERQQQARMSQMAGQSALAGAANFARRDDQSTNLNNLFALEKMSNTLFESAASAQQGLGEMSAGRYAAYQKMRGQANSSQKSFFGGLAKMGGALLGALAFSDEKLKNNIQLVGKENGHNIYTWEWNDVAKKLGINDINTGVLAQEVIQYKPEAVSIHENGYYMVDYRVL